MNLSRYEAFVLSDAVMADIAQRTGIDEPPHMLRERFGLERDADANTLTVKTKSKTSEGARVLAEIWHQVTNEQFVFFISPLIAQAQQRYQLEFSAINEGLDDIGAYLREGLEEASLLAQVGISTAYGERFVSVLQNIYYLNVLQENIEDYSYALIIKHPFTPEAPIAPRKMLNMAVAGVLGVMISAFFVLFLHYWETSKDEKTAIGLGKTE